MFKLLLSYRRFFLIVLCLAPISCKKEINQSNNPPDQLLKGQIKGNVVLPQGSKINLNDLQVVSSSDNSKIVDGKYTLDTLGHNRSCYFVSDSIGTPYLMSYNYFGKSDNDFTAHSTALGMIMITQIVQSLSELGRTSFINKIQATDDFKKLEVEVTKLLIENKSFTDTTNIALRQIMGKTMETATKLQAQSVLNEPLIFYKNGRQITLVNNGVACTYVVGLYKDGQRIGDLKKIDAAVFSSTSIVDAPFAIIDIYSGKFGSQIEPDVETINLVGDGKFDLKIRSGFPNNSDAEQQLALKEDVIQNAINLLSIISGLSFKKPCVEALKNRIIGTINIYSIYGSEFNTFATKFYEASAFSLSSMKDIIECSYVGGVKDYKLFYKGLEQVVKWITWISIIQSAVSISPTVFHLFLARSNLDTCFTAVGNTIGSCDEGKFTDPRDGQVYSTKKIGTQIWMTKNLNYNSLGSWCNDCDTYGRLYNWHTSLSVAPPGWHLPTDAEWTILSDYLGGEYLAGGKMKDLSNLWKSPNVGATNSSGFNGLPGGATFDGVPQYVSQAGFWWSSTPYDNERAHLRALPYDNSFLFNDWSDKVAGLSVRCIKD